MKESKKNLFIFFLLLCCLSIAKPVFLKTLKSITPAIINRDTTLLETDEIAVWFINNGSFARHPITGNAGFYYPKETQKTLIYVSGLRVAAKVNDEIRTACVDYITEYQPGVILPSGTPDNPDLERYRIYSIRQGDSADPDDPNYNQDYAEWPVEDGAPLDENGNPLILGDQTIWFVINDGNLQSHANMFNTEPLNLEVHVLAWAFRENNSALDKSIFIQYTLINKNELPITDAYIGMFVDADVGSAVDDMAACDTTLNLSYAYNQGYEDDMYRGAVPAVGVVLLQGPVVPFPGETAAQFLHDPIPDAKLLNLTSNSIYYCVHERFYAPPYSAEGAIKIYGNFQGRDARGDLIYDPITGTPSPFMNSGDPVTGTGWIDSFCGDINFIPGSGPFSIEPSDTQRVVFAVVVGHDANIISSILDLRQKVNQIRNGFYTNFSLDASVETKINYLSDLETEVTIQAGIIGDVGVSSVRTEIYDYYQNYIQEIELFDDGSVDNGIAGDNIFGSVWKTAPTDSVFYLKLIITDVNSNQYNYSYADYNLTLSDKITFNQLEIADDHINNDKKINPGENVRLTFSFTNNYSHELKGVTVTIETEDPYVSYDPAAFYFDSVGVNESFGLNYDLNDVSSYFSIYVSPDVPDTHSIKFNIHLFDNQLHHWKKEIVKKVEPLEYLPNKMYATHSEGRSEAYCAIKVIYPNDLTGHTYMITISDSINEDREKGFNLIDQTLGITLLENHELPGDYAYNVPITEGFKVVEIFLPEGGLTDVYYENVANGNETGFEGVNYGGDFFNGGIFLGGAEPEEIYSVELVFTNVIDSSGIEGVPGGQSAFRYEIGNSGGPTGFFPCPFEAWKVSSGQRLGLLNVCFQENPYLPTYNDQWAPDYSYLGGVETLYIMKTDYDVSGTLYNNKSLNMKDVMYKLHLRLRSETSIVDIGDKFIFDWEAAGSSEDVFTFIPTEVEQENPKGMIRTFELYQNYPNPFNSSTIIRFSLEKSGHVSLVIYNMLGQKVIDLIDEELEPGLHIKAWSGISGSGEAVSSGLYLVRLISQQQERLIKILLIR